MAELAIVSSSLPSDPFPMEELLFDDACVFRYASCMAFTSMATFYKGLCLFFTHGGEMKLDIPRNTRHGQNKPRNISIKTVKAFPIVPHDRFNQQSTPARFNGDKFARFFHQPSSAKASLL